MLKRRLIKALPLLSLAFASAAAATPPIAHYLSGHLSPSPVDHATVTDAIVVFTGMQARIDHGYAMLAGGRAQHLYITGFDYHPPVLRAAVPVEAVAMTADRITIDLRARNTIENAIDTAGWVMDNNITSLTLVTSDAHMPRAFFELRRLLPASVTIYTEALETPPRDQGLYSEENKLTCRVYETFVGGSFCYPLEDTAQALNLS